MKKFAVLFILITLMALGIFLAGWVQIRVPAGFFGVYVTKTRGWNAEVIHPGSFSWTWEALIPTNLRLLHFSLEPRTETVSLEGSLPSAEVYSDFAAGKPDFSYSVTFTITAAVKPEALPGIAESRGVDTQEALDSWLADRIRTTGETLRGLIATGGMDEAWMTALLRGDPEITSDLAARITQRVPELEILEVSALSLRIPDLELYNAVKAQYLAFLQSTGSALARTLEREAQTRAQTELRLESLERYGKLITKYPKLIDFLAVENRVDAALLEALGNRAE
ncbi:MAG TPA: hypothetical protein VLH39_05320 [Magnetospirillaceae bacterium]|nr:hypothetical protein [Magnetospirillaceae bacterium]